MFPFSMRRARCPTPVLSLLGLASGGLALLALPVLWLGVCPTLVLVQVPAVSWWAFQRLCLLFCSTVGLGGYLNGRCWLTPGSSFLSSLVYRTTVIDARCIYPAATKGHCPHCYGDVPGHDQRVFSCLSNGGGGGREGSQERKAVLPGKLAAVSPACSQTFGAKL